MTSARGSSDETGTRQLILNVATLLPLSLDHVWHWNRDQRWKPRDDYNG